MATQHAWANAGDYTLTLTVSDASGSRTITKTIHVTTSPVVITNPYQGFPQDGRPRANPAVTLPQPENTSPLGGSSSTGTPGVAAPGWLWALVAILAIIALAAIAFGVSMARRPAMNTAAGVVSPAEAERQRREQAVRGLLTPRSPDQRPPEGSGSE